MYPGHSRRLALFLLDLRGPSLRPWLHSRCFVAYGTARLFAANAFHHRMVNDALGKIFSPVVKKLF